MYGLEGNLFDYDGNNYKNEQKIKIFQPYLDENKGGYQYKTTINLNDYLKDQTKDPRITKIEIDDRGFILLTDINNNKVHILKPEVENYLQLDRTDTSILNQITFQIYKY